MAVCWLLVATGWEKSWENGLAATSNGFNARRLTDNCLATIGHGFEVEGRNNGILGVEMVTVRAINPAEYVHFNEGTKINQGDVEVLKHWFENQRLAGQGDHPSHISLQTR